MSELIKKQEGVRLLLLTQRRKVIKKDAKKLKTLRLCSLCAFALIFSSMRSDELRRWFSHEEERWEEFKSRYFDELNRKEDLLKELRALAENKIVTLLYASKEREKNNAKALLEFLEKQ